MEKDGTDIYRCDCNTIHEEVVIKVRQQMLDDDTYIDIADIFKIFCDSTRVKIIGALLHAEMCVCDISVLLGMTKSSISHQLRILKQAKMVKYRRDGRVIYYSLADRHVKAIFDQGLAHVYEKE
ncbi:ArsR/SmtB family transcription factor [Megasphaera cerevisiae]|uniref:ArsR/SmtB family transcription factor n=1 Tax=Megasphaera cerevisiae TaxID=39029 RepID=UPI0009459FB6|nr:metalloregulator ArsR/SmtB family transcription factor [Megasphaera cerevisiae]OKY52708.1 transcriptional regulator [Megasphaera cerevisiae]